MTVEEKFQRAVALLQLLVNSEEEFFDVCEEVRAQLKEWGYNVLEKEW